MGCVGDGKAKQRKQQQSISYTHAKTKAFDDDSLCLGEKVKDGDSNELHPFQSAMRFDDTLHLESDFLVETEVVGEVAGLNGETQVIEYLDCEEEWVEEFVTGSKVVETEKTKVVGEVADLNGETQVIEYLDCEKECVEEFINGSDVDETEKTEVLSNGDGISDDETNVCRIDDIDSERDIGDEVMGLEKKQSIPLCSYDKGKEDYLVNSDASMDGECNSVLHQVAAEPNPGSVWGSFASVRIATLRSSGLAAANSITRKGTDIRQNPTSSIIRSTQKEDNIEVLHSGPGTDGIEKGDRSASLRDLTFIGTKVHEQNHVHETLNSHRRMQDIFGYETNSRIKNSRVRKLFYEYTPTGENEAIDKITLTTIKMDPPQLLESEHEVAGLRYVESQVPSEESQANALDIVDKFLSLDVELSGDFDTGKPLGWKSPPVSSAKGVQSLAKRACRRSPVRKEGIFDWIDSREDESGGNFFSKRKDILFEDTQSRKIKHLTYRRTKNAVDKCRDNGEDRGTEIHQKIMGLTHPESRLTLQSSIESDKIQISDSKSKKNFFTELSEQSNAESSGEQLGTTSIGRSSQDIWDIGVNTQLAAEALEALVCGPPASHDFVDAFPVTEGSNRRVTKNKGHTKHVSVNKRDHSTSDSDGTMRQTRAKNEKSKHEEHFDTGKFVNGNSCSHRKSSRFVKRRQTGGALTRKCINKVDKCHGSLISESHLSFNKTVIQEEHLHGTVAPIAHRTRQSMMNLLKRSKISSNDSTQVTNCSMDNGILQNKRRRVNIIADSPETLTIKEKSSKSGPNQTPKLRKNKSQLEERIFEGALQEEKSQISKDASSYTNGQRTRRSMSCNLDNPTNYNVPFMALDGVVEANAQTSTWGKSFKTNVTSTFLSFNTVKRKTRSAARATLPLFPLPMAVIPKPDVASCSSPNKTAEVDNFASEPCEPSDLITPGSTRVPIISGIRTRSSGASDPSMFSYKKFKESLTRDKIFKSGSVDAAVNCSMDVTNDNAHPEDLILPTSGGSESEFRADSSILPVEVSPKEKGPSKETIALSPVCTGDGSQKLSGKRCVSRSSLMRELVRLDATEAAKTLALKGMRRRRDMTSVSVLFSHHLGEDIIKQQKKIVTQLGVSIAYTSSDATHFIADKFVRTRNMLEAIARGKPVVTHSWLESCRQASCFIDEKSYILRDLKKEKEIGFSMPVSLARACQTPLLQGKRVYITPNVKPDREMMASLVRAVHGQAIKRIGRSTTKDSKIPNDLLVISCEEDYSVCTPLLERGAEIYSSELLLNGIVIQNLEYERHRLFMDHVKRTRSTIWLRKEVGNQFLPVAKCR